MDFAIDSAFDLSSSAATCPSSVTTPLSRSWLTETSLRLASSRDLRIVAATSGDFLGDSEHAAKDPTESRTAKLKHRFIVFIFFLLVAMGDCLLYTSPSPRDS